MKDEGAVERAKQVPRELNRTLEAVMIGLQREPKVLRDDQRAARRARVIARIGEASRRFEQDLELEQDIVLVFEVELVEPTLAQDAMLAVDRTRAAEERAVR